MEAKLISKCDVWGGAKRKKMNSAYNVYELLVGRVYNKGSTVRGAVGNLNFKGWFDRS